MAIVRNYREHDISLNLIKENQGLQFVCPAMHRGENPDKSGEIIEIPGIVEIPDDVLAAARKQYPAIEAYFAEKWLRVVKKKEPTQAPADAITPAVPKAPEVPEAPAE